MNLDNYYLHATGGYYGQYNSKNRIIQILEDESIKPGIEKNYGMSPINKVCLCDPSLYQKVITTANFSFDSFVLYSPTIVLSRNLSVLPSNMHADEVRHFGNISIENFKFITFPLWPEDTRLKKDFNVVENLKIFKSNILTITKDFNTIPIKDIYTGKNITADEVERQIEVFQKKLK